MYLDCRNCTGILDCRREFRKARNELVVPQTDLSGNCPAAWVYTSDFNDDHPSTALGPFFVIPDLGTGYLTVFPGEVGAHRRHNQPVPGGQFPNLAFLEKARILRLLHVHPP
jgi:hypothetical protein